MVNVKFDCWDYWWYNMGWRILKKHFIKTIETCLCMKGENTMRDLKDEIFFDYDSYDDLLEDI